MIEENKIDQFLMSWRSVNRHLRKGMLTHGDHRLTRMQWTLLRYVNKTENCTMGNLAEQFNVSQSTVSQMIDRVQKWGLVERTAAAHDARVKIVSLTDKGINIIEDMKAVWVKQLSAGLNTFSSEELDQFIGFLHQLSGNLRDVSDQES